MMARFFIALLLIFGALPLQAAPNHIAATLVPESPTPVAGSQVTLALAMKPAAQWHGYWQNPGDAGIATRMVWDVSGGLRFGPLLHPVPQTLLIAGLMNYVYERDYALLTTVKVPAGLAAGTRLPIRAKVDWLACNPQTCVPETATLATMLTIGDGRIAPERQALFDRWRAALPRPLSTAAHYQVDHGRLRLGLPLPASAQADQPYFFPTTDGAIDYAAPQTVTRDGDRLVVETAARPHGPDRIEGVMRLAGNVGVTFTATPGPVPAPAAGSGTSGGGPWLAIAAALLGGLLLNVMPCVFPILSLKALSLARAGGSEREARGEAVAYTAGAVLCCAALGGIILALKAAGEQAGWAFQLQNPQVIAALLLLVIAIAFNLAGLFELPVMSGGGRLAGAGGVAGAFWTGALAAFVATPCAGPFLGTALGAALVLPPVQAMAIFAGLGLGLALPFLLLGFVPALRRKLPKPGPWMARLRHILAIPMFATALGLAWVLGKEAGVTGMTIGLAAALIAVLGLWGAGNRQAALKSRAWLPPLVAIAISAGLVATIAPATPASAQADASHVPFNEAKLVELRASGRPIFLYFTADWCLTCKVNETAAIERAEVKSAFAARHVAVMVGDWTRGDPAISRFLAAHGRSGVPFYLYYPAGGGEPHELPQLLTPALLTGLS